MRASFYTLVGIAAFSLACPELACARGDFRLEAHVGWDQNGRNIDPLKTFEVPKNYVESGKLNASGVMYGANIGYDMPVAPLVSVGVDAAVSGTSAGVQSINRAKLDINLDIYAGARVTVHALPGMRLYAKVGYATAKFRVNPGLYFGQLARSAIDLDTVRSNAGVRFGLGVQQTLFGSLYGLAEYRHTRYSQQTTRNQVVTGLGLRF